MRIEITREGGWWHVQLWKPYYRSYSAFESPDIFKVFFEYEKVLAFLATVDVSEIERVTQIERVTE